MKQFSELGIVIPKSFVGNQVFIENILNKKIIIEYFQIKPSKKNDGSNCIHMQIRMDEKQHVIFSGSTFLMSQLTQLKDDDFPVEAVIKKLTGITNFHKLNIMTDFKTIPLSEIHPDKNQPRKYYDEADMDELTDSIREKGVLQPILVRPNEKGYIIVCGERRYKAALSVNAAFKNRNTIPAVVRILDDAEALELQIVENLQRKDVHPMEEAVAFKSLLENKNRKISIEEIAAKVGKSLYYIRQRIKLNSLSKDWQEVFYKNKIHVSTALEISQLAQNEQAILFKNKVDKKRLCDIHYEPGISDWDLKNLRRALKSAPFDTKDESLNPKMGPCTTCPFNSAVASLFPEDAKDPICNNPGCYQIKCDVSFDRRLKEVLEDPANVLIYDYDRSDAGKKLLEKMRKEHKVYETGYGYGDGPSCQVRHSPDKKDIQSGKLVKGFYIVGEERGRTVWVEILNVKPKTTSKNTADKIKDGKATADDIDSELIRIREREKRSKEIDLNNIHKETIEAVDKKKKDILAMKYQSIDRGIMIFILLQECSGFAVHDKFKIKGLDGYVSTYHKAGYNEEVFKQLSKVTDDQLAILIREIAFSKWLNKNFASDVRIADTGMRLIAQYAGIDIKSIEQAQKEITDKRNDRINKRIAALQLTKKNLSGKNQTAAKIAKAKPGKKK